MKYTLYLLLLMLFYKPYGQGFALSDDSYELQSEATYDKDSAVACVKCFYAACMNDDYLGKIDSLESSMLTPYMIEKVHRMSYMMDQNALLRASDYDEEMLRTLQVTPIAGRWLRVTYETKMENKVVKWNIPLRVNEHYRIDFITPPWGKSSEYGDHLFFESYPATDIDDRNPLSFLKTFYMAYVTHYVTLCDTLQSMLKELRISYGTDEFLEQWSDMEFDSVKDGTPYYDMLIADFDFDKRWISSLKVEAVGDNIYRVSYRDDRNQLIEIELELMQVDGKYRINYVFG